MKKKVKQNRTYSTGQTMGTIGEDWLCQPAPRHHRLGALVALCGGLSLLYAPTLFAQQDTQQSMYWASPTAFNPAMAGCDSALHITAFDRMQWVGVEDAPQTFFVSADLPVMLGRKRSGIGLSILNDKAGLFTTTLVNAQLDYSLKLFGGRLALGVQPAFVNQTFDGSGVHLPVGTPWSTTDIPSSEVSGMAFDLGAGAYYEWKNYYLGLSAQHLLSSQVELGEYAYTEFTPTFYFYAGGNIPLKHTLFILQPSLLVKSTFQFTQYDITLRTLWNNKFWGGVTYRPGDAMVLMVGADIEHIRLGYAYDVPLSQMSLAGGGSHELLATYTLHIDLDKQKRRGNKSIRIL